MLQVDRLTRQFGDHVAVDGVSFDVPDGQLVGFVGGNGAGKTTTMRMIMGVLAIHGGEVRVDGRPITAAPARTRRGLAIAQATKDTEIAAANANLQKTLAQVEQLVAQANYLATRTDLLPEELE